MEVETQRHTDHEVVFFIDQDRFITRERELTVRTLLVDFAKEDPSQTTLVEIRGKERIKLTDLNHEVRLHEGERFLVYHNGPTPVS